MIFSWLQAALIIFLAGGLAFAAGPLLGSVILAPRYSGGAMGEPYECGLPTHGGSFANFGINYYFYAIVFLAFEVAILYLFPVSTWFTVRGARPGVEDPGVSVRPGIGGCLFPAKGVFEWPRRIQISPGGNRRPGGADFHPRGAAHRGRVPRHVHWPMTFGLACCAIEMMAVVWPA
jgi:NADH-quinone oxidoreductase subunit A